MGMAIEPIKIQGLREFQAALKDLDGESQKQLRVVFNTVAETVAAGARRRVPTKSGRARASVKTASSQREARVKAGGARVSYYPWLDFGGKTGIKGSVRRPFVQSGRYLYPAYDANRASIVPALEAAMEDMIRSVGWDVS